jgi:peptidoglycan L-alanyl-D-glutamate endopeptidase CwlK
MPASLDDLAPVFLSRVRPWLAACRDAKLDPLVYCTYRSREEQAKLYAIGRTRMGADPSPSRPMGRTVTNAKPGTSAHNYGLALDFVPLLYGKAQWKAPSELYDKCINLAIRHGLESLRDSPKFKEYAHLQFPNWKVVAGIN